MAINRIGIPGGMSTFSYLARSAAPDEEVIVYARDMITAVQAYRRRNGQEPYQIRQMSDNE